MTFTASSPILADRAFGRRGTINRTVATVILGALALWISAKVQIPFYPVPQTMQTFVVLAIGSVLGWRVGAVTVALYLAEGMSGLPVFAGTPAHGIGLAYMTGPTGGYLVGYLGAATLCGWLAERGWNRTVVATAVATTLGMVLIYGAGLTWLGTVVGWDKPVMAWGVTPFLFGDAIKVGLASIILPTLWRHVGQDRTTRS